MSVAPRGTDANNMFASVQILLVLLLGPFRMKPELSVQPLSPYEKILGPSDCEQKIVRVLPEGLPIFFKELLELIPRHCT